MCCFWRVVLVNDDAESGGKSCKLAQRGDCRIAYGGRRKRVWWRQLLPPLTVCACAQPHHHHQNTNLV